MAGVILVAERSVKPGDVLEVEGKVVKAIEVGIRATIMLTRNSENLSCVPNPTLAQSTVKSSALREPIHRLRAAVGVFQGAEMREVQATLEQAARGVDACLAERAAVVL